MRPSIGSRDTLITFQQRTGTQDTLSGAWTYTWANLASNPTEYADVQDVLPSKSEYIVDQMDIKHRPTRVRTLFRSDITSDMRITIEGRTGSYRIISGPAELGRRDGLEMICDQLSTDGEDT